MSKLLSCLLMTAVVAGLMTVGGTSPAQQKDTKKDTKVDPKADPKADTKAAKGGGVVKVNEGKDGKFRFSVYDADEKFVGGSGPVGYATKEDAAKAIDGLKATLATAKIEYGKKDEKKTDDKK